MKNFVILITLITFLPNLLAQTNDAYNFDLVTNMSDWRDIPYPEKVERIQIPEKILKQMSTEGLVETCLNYPLFIVTLAYNYPQHGFNQIVAEFNGFSELFNREDAASILLKKYIDMDLEGKFRGDLFYMEFLIAQNEILAKLSDYEVVILLESCFEKIISKQHIGYSAFFMQVTPLIMGRTLYERISEFGAITEKNNQIELFLKSGKLSNSEVASDILNAAEQYLQSKK
jgi:hypothetical protein